MANIPNIYGDSWYESNTGSWTGEVGKDYATYSNAGQKESTDAFNQIAPRPRDKRNFDRVLRAEIHDPLFMIARQWQMGEFEFEDTGSAIFAKIAMDLSKLSRIKVGAVAEEYSDDIPLETRVERQHVKLSLKEKVRMGEQWIRMLKKEGDKYNYNGGGTPPSPLFSIDTYKAEFLDITTDPLNHYSFDQVPDILVSDEDDDILYKAKLLTQTKTVQYLNLISGRKVDGAKIMATLSADETAFNSITGTTFGFVEDVAEAFVKWVNEIYSVPESSDDNYWNAESFSYNAEVSSPQVDSSGTPIDNRVLSVKDYSSDKLDWYAFDEQPGASGNPLETAYGSVEPTETITMIPTPGSFPGMPASRWWEFEEGNMNIAGADLSATDTVKSVLAEFALVYQDDWFVLPKLVPVGSTAKVTGIVVKDVFGQHTFVQHTSKSPHLNSDWSSWDMYSQTNANTTPGVDASDDSLFFAPSTNDIMMSDALEEVVFIRDEMANMVFAIEKKIWSELGEGIDAVDAAGAIKQFLLDRRPETLPETPDADLRYELGNTVPFNWIPFIPVHNGGGTNRSIRLQRASMPLILSDYMQMPIRPRTDFLRTGLNDDDSLSATPKYFIQEEIIPRAGIKLEKKLQRTRWYNGKTYLWLSHSKHVGRGQGNSNLQFDRVLDTQKV